MTPTAGKDGENKVRAGVVSIPIDVARLIRNVFLPHNPNKMRKATPEVVQAAKDFIAAVELYGPTR